MGFSFWYKRDFINKLKKGVRIPLEPITLAKKTHLYYFSLIVGVSVLFILLYWRNSLLFGLAPFDGDILPFFYPTWYVGKNLLLTGFHFLWDPFRNMGQPFLASPQNQALYPLRFIAPFFDFIDYQRIFLIFHVLLAAVFSFLVSEKLFSNRKASIFFMLAYAFGGFFYWRVLYQSDFATMAWLPVVLYFYLSGRVIPLGIAMAFQWLAGFPPFVILTLLILIAFISTSKNRVLNFKLFGKAVLIFIGLTALQIIPFLELLRESGRGLFLDKSIAVEGSIHPYSILEQLFIPSFYLSKIKHLTIGINGFYIGPIMMTLFFVGTLRGNKQSNIFSFMAFVGLTLSMGKHIGIYQFIPGITLFRYPALWFLIFNFFVIYIAAKGLSRIKNKSIQNLILILFAADLLIMTHQLEFAWGNKNYFTEKSTFLVPNENLDTEHRIFHSSAILYNKHKWGHLSDETWKFKKDILLPSYAVSFGLREVSSHYTLVNRRSLNFQNRLNTERDLNLFSLADVGTIVKLKEESEFIKNPSYADIQIVHNLTPKGRAFLLNKNNDIRILKDKPGHLRLLTKGPGKIIFSESYYPGWKVKVNGTKKNIELFEDTFMSVDIPEGDQAVEFYYFPYSFLIGLILSLLTLVFITSFCSRNVIFK